MHGLLEGQGSTGITLRAFRLNAAVNHLMFAGCRGRVYDRIVVLSGVQPGDSVLDVGSSSGYLTGRLAAAAGPSGRVTGVDPSEPAISYARRRARPGMTFTVGVAQDLGRPERRSTSSPACWRCTIFLPASARRLRRDVPDNQTRRPPADRGSGPAAAPQRRQAAAADPLRDLAAVAGYRVDSAGRLRCSATSWPSAPTNPGVNGSRRPRRGARARRPGPGWMAPDGVRIRRPRGAAGRCRARVRVQR